jgi:L-alanine-DL-glutamate epimerase-like enolase superfamily enzyme
MRARPKRSSPSITGVEVHALEIPTDSAKESDGTLEWDKTTIIIVEILAGGERGLGYSYADRAAATLIDGKLASVIAGGDPFDIPRLWLSLVRSVRNLGRPGVASAAISALDLALWDLKGKLLGLSVGRLLGAERARVPVYGSGGFTSYSEDELREQLGGWVEQGITRVKMKVGRAPSEDPSRVRAARDAIGEKAELFVDANGAYSRKEAFALAGAFAESGVTWFEEPVSSDDLEGLRLIRDRAPAGMSVTAGEYGYEATYFRRMLAAGAVDVLQADITRCGGVTGFLRVAALCDAWNLPLSAHTAPVAHLHACCAAPRVIHQEWFHDHVRIEGLLFDGAPTPVEGMLQPDLSRPGLGVELKRAELPRLAA